MSEKIVTVFGTSRAKPSEKIYQTAYKIGKALAENGFVVANGGYGGVMQASGKGAAEAGGEVVGVTCLAFKRSSANEYITREISTKSLQERLDTLVKLGCGYIVLQGGTGTLLELAESWELKNKGFLNDQKPIILIGRFWQPLLDLIATDDPDSLQCLHLADGPKEAIDILCKFNEKNFDK